MEWDKNLLPQSFRARVDHGDRVALLGRWILDAGHDPSGYLRTEIHPPLVMATGNVSKDPQGAPLTRVLFIARPYLAGQTYVVDVADAYDDAADDDGPLFNHLVKEVLNVIELDSRQVEAHPKIKSFPFRGAHRFQFTIRLPQLADSTKFRLVVSFQFTVRSGCHIRVTSPTIDAINVVVSVSENEYKLPLLPDRIERSYGADELDTLSPGSGWKTELADALAAALAGYYSWAGPWMALYGIRTFWPRYQDRRV